MEQDLILRAENLRKVFRSGRGNLVLFDDLSFQVQAGEMLAIVGQSGAGKSTLLHILGALDRPSAGDVYCAHYRLQTLSDEAAAEFRNREIGFVWQFHYLLPEFTALENVAMPLLLRGQSQDQAFAEAGRWLDEVGLTERSTHRSGELSGGEQQRVALARALVTRPRVLLADEPTGDLDGATAEAVFALIARLHRDYRLTSLIATHNLAFARRCSRVLRLQGGQLQEVSPELLTASELLFWLLSGLSFWGELRYLPPARKRVGDCRRVAENRSRGHRGSRRLAGLAEREHVRTVHGKSQTRDLLRPVRGQPVRVPVH